MAYILYKKVIRKGYLEDDGSDLRTQEEEYVLVSNEPKYGEPHPETGEQEVLSSEEDLLQEWYGEECQNQDYSYQISMQKVLTLSYFDLNNLFSLFETDKVRTIITKIREVEN